MVKKKHQAFLSLVLMDDYFWLEFVLNAFDYTDNGAVAINDKVRVTGI